MPAALNTDFLGTVTQFGESGTEKLQTVHAIKYQLSAGKGFVPLSIQRNPQTTMNCLNITSVQTSVFVICTSGNMHAL